MNTRRTLQPLAIALAFLGIQVSALADDRSEKFELGFSACNTTVLADEEAKLRSDQRRLESLATPLESKLRTYNGATSVRAKSVEIELRALQVNLLRVLERLECLRLGALGDPIVRGPNLAPIYFVEARINYVTDRLKEPDVANAGTPDPNHYFSGALDENFKDFSFGKVTVTIPTKRSPGELNLPDAWKLVSEVDPSRYFVLRSVDEGSREALFKELNEAGVNNDSTLLLFVHGFNVTFSDAALRTAQLAHDLQFRGKVLLYSWPSAGKVTEYWKDEDSSRISTPRFGKLLAELLSTTTKRIFVVAHSMGTRIVIPAIPTLVSRGIDVSKVSELMLAAADFNAIEFKELAVDFAKLRTGRPHVTIYAASNDFALQASRRIHSYRRLGESDPSLTTYRGLDSVDASAAAPVRRAYGHSYVSDSALVLGDMQDLILKGLTPLNRGLIPVANTGNSGWKISVTP